MFRVGQKVVYWDNSPRNDGRYWVGKNSPVLNAVYTVRAVFIGNHGDKGLLLQEIVNPFDLLFKCEPGFKARRFRPIVSRPTSIEFAHEILRKVNAPALPSTRTSEVLG